MPGIALCLLWLFALSLSGHANATPKIEDLFARLDAIIAQTTGNLATPLIAQEVQPACKLSLSDTASAVEALARTQPDIEKSVAVLDTAYQEIIKKMPRVGAPKNACDRRIKSEIQSFREDVSALDLRRLIKETDDVTSCILAMRQQIETEQKAFETSRSEDITALKLRFNRQMKATTDLDFKRNEFAVFLDQADGYLKRRVQEIDQSEQINCSEGDVFE